MTSPSTCAVCGAGKYSELGASMCSFCPAGTYSAASAVGSSATCAQCAAGSYASGLGLTAACPHLCDAGRYSISSAATSSAVCELCFAGAYASGSGLTTSGACLLCAAGKYSSAAGAVAPATCTACGAGLYASGLGMSSSDQCKRIHTDLDLEHESLRMHCLASKEPSRGILSIMKSGNPCACLPAELAACCGVNNDMLQTNSHSLQTQVLYQRSRAALPFYRQAPPRPLLVDLMPVSFLFWDICCISESVAVDSFLCLVCGRRFYGSHVECSHSCVHDTIGYRSTTSLEPLLGLLDANAAAGCMLA
jgi:hypothetical protein